MKSTYADDNRSKGLVQYWNQEDAAYGRRLYVCTQAAVAAEGSLPDTRTGSSLPEISFQVRRNISRNPFKAVRVVIAAVCQTMLPAVSILGKPLSVIVRAECRSS